MNFIELFHKVKLRPKFYFGVTIFILNFVIGKIAQLMFLRYINEPIMMWTAVILYLFSWVLLFLGIWWAGKEYLDAIARYFSLKYYSDHAKKGASKAISKAKEIHSITREKAARVIKNKRKKPGSSK